MGDSMEGNVMDYRIARNMPISATTATPHAVALSRCNTLAAISLQGIHVYVRRFLFPALLVMCASWGMVVGYDFTDQVFESDVYSKDQLLLAFGDFNGDKLTDAFVVEKDIHSFKILLAHEKPPYLRGTPLSCTFENRKIESLVPGDFDGDTAMDLLVLTKSENNDVYDVFIAWGSLTGLECPYNLTNPMLQVIGHPLVLDYDGDFISDLFGLDIQNSRTFWIFKNRSPPHEIPMKSGSDLKELRKPHSHGFVDLDGDMNADLLLSGTEAFELWSRDANFTFSLKEIIPLPVKGSYVQTGQSVFVDVNFDGTLDHLVPVCVDSSCTNSSFYAYVNNKWLPLECNLRQGDKVWGFIQPSASGYFYHDTITARAGDFNLDGYPDFLVPVANTKASRWYPEYRVVLLQNNPCDDCIAGRRLDPLWDVLSEWNTSISMAAFYDVQENGVLDILLAHQVDSKTTHLAAYRNALDYDANFIKVLVLTGRCFTNCSHGQVPYGTNLPGPVISYRTTKPNGELQLARSAQLSQSAYQALQLPYALFGLGHTPNFVEVLQVGLSHPDPERRRREWTQIIPNSQMIIIPNLQGQPRSWLNKLFVTPSRAIVLSAAALGGFGFLLALVVFGLHCRERQADKLEKLSQAYRFHFDAM